jgi:hypothetical protein
MIARERELDVGLEAFAGLGIPASTDGTGR